ncbi:MAG: SPOR domain-containing protein [Acidobacteriota bacterium]
MRGDGGFGHDSGTTKRRMLPAVTDVVRELARSVSADPAVLFKAARSVVADELAKVKQGFESAPLDVLVRRARRQLEQEGVVAPATEELEEPKSVSIPAPPLKPKKAAAPSSDGPFQGAGAADLDWEKDFNIQSDDAPFRSAILPLPPRSRAPVGIAPPEKTAVPAPAAPGFAAPPPPSFSRLPAPDRVLAPGGLAVERSGAAPRPKPAVDDLPLFSSPTLELSSPLAPAPPPVARTPFVPEPRPVEEIPAFTPPEPLPPPHVEEPDFERPDPWARAAQPPAYEPPAPRLDPPGKSISEMPPLAPLVGDATEPVEPAMEEFAFKAAEAPAPPKKSGRTGWIVAIAVVLAVAAGLIWAVRTFLSGDVVKKVEAPAPAPKKLEAPAPAPPPVAAPVPAPAPKPAPAAAVVSKGKAAPLVTPDWAGKPVVYVVHFSSHKDRPSAEKEARRLASELGKPGRAVEVDLGAKGTWFRVVIGEFANVDEARAYRADLEAKKTPNLGFVYEMRGR